MSAAAIQFMFAPVVAQSVAGFLWLAVRMRRTGGQVRAEALGLPDLILFTSLAVAFIQVAVLSFSHKATVPTSFRPLELLTVPLLIITVDCCVAGFLMFRRISLKQLAGWGRLPLWRVALWALGLLLLALPSVFALSVLCEHYLPKDFASEQILVSLFRNEVRQGHWTSVAVVIGAAGILAPIGEEFLFRGFLYPVGKRYFGATPSAVLTAVLFALLHGNVVSFAGLCLLALFFTIAYERTGSLLVSMGMHSLFNSVNLLLLVAQATGASS